MHTSAGDFVIDVTRAWAPNGADRFYNLVRAGYFTQDVALLHVLIPGFIGAKRASHLVVPSVARAWCEAAIPDDPVVQRNTRGYVTFADVRGRTRARRSSS